MRRRYLAVMTIGAIWVVLLAAPIARAQYTQGLPAGILNVEVDGQPIDSVTVPVTNNSSPEISGRVDLGVAMIELAIADGDIIRFQAELDDRGRFRVAVPQALSDGQYTLYIGDVLIGAFAVSGALPEEREPGQLLDIARVVPYPVDFGDQIPGLGFLDGRFYAIEEEALRTAAAGNGEAANTRAAQRGLVESGWLQRYENRLAAPNPDDPATFTVQISSFVVEYASGADARTAFAALVGEDQGVEFPTVGNESVLALLSGFTPDTGAEYQAARLVFRLGSMLVMIVYADLQNQPPDLVLLDAVAQAVAARGVVVADRQTVALGSMALRLDPAAASGPLVRRDVYEVRAGTITALYGENEETLAGRLELVTGTTDVFTSTTSGTFSSGGARASERDNRDAAAEQAPTAAPTPTSVISIEGESPAVAEPATPPVVTTAETAGTPRPEAEETAQVSMVSSLYAFPGEGEADAWLATQRDQLLANPERDGATFAEVADGTSLGDATATFASAWPTGSGDESVSGYRIYSRVGAIVAVVDVASIPEVSLRNATSIMEQQIACIEAQGCSGPANLPGGLFGRRGEETGPAATEPAAAATPASELPPSESVIIVEGEGTVPEATRQPRENREDRPDRERRRDRSDDEQDAGAAG